MQSRHCFQIGESIVRDLSTVKTQHLKFRHPLKVHKPSVGDLPAFGQFERLEGGAARKVGQASVRHLRKVTRP